MIMAAHEQCVHQASRGYVVRIADDAPALFRIPCATQFLALCPNEEEDGRTQTSQVQPCDLGHQQQTAATLVCAQPLHQHLQHKSAHTLLRQPTSTLAAALGAVPRKLTNLSAGATCRNLQEWQQDMSTT